MAVGKCEQCGVEEYMPFSCKFCQGHFCVSHRLPESHTCSGLGPYREKLRKEGRVMHTPDQEVMRPTVRRASLWSAKMDGIFDRVQGKMHVVLVVAVAVVFVLQHLVLGTLGLDAHRALFVLGPNVLYYPWTLVTSIFAHDPGSLFHILINAFILYTFGGVLERFLGTRRFTTLFFAGGIFAGLVQLVFINLIMGSPAGSLGASGAIMALLGTLTLLAPHITVLLMFIIPMPLWLITVLFAAFNLVGALGGGGNIAYAAHLGGLALGLWYGKHLKDRGLQLQAQPRTGAGMWGGGGQGGFGGGGRRW